MIFIFLFLLATILGGSFYAYRVAFYNPQSAPDRAPDITGTVYEAYREEIIKLYQQLQDRECEFVTITSDDGLTLFGRYYHVANGAPLDIGFHGYRSRSFTDFAGGSVMSFSMGHNLLLVDQRAHGQSDGRTITFGIRERWDVVSWVDYAAKRFGKNTEIYLYGVSMGGSTVLMASNLHFSGNVRAIIADCPFSSPIDIILHVGKNHPIPHWLIRPLAIMGAKIFGGFDLLETSAEKCLQDAAIPVLIIHGAQDHFVPAKMSELTYLAPSRITRVTFPGADHALSYLTDTERYHAVVRDFLKSIQS